jgi:hypothetical protein
MVGGCRNLHTEELRNLYPSSSIIRVIKSRMRLAGRVARMGEKRKVYKMLVAKTGENIQLRRYRCT